MAIMEVNRRERIEEGSGGLFGLLGKIGGAVLGGLVGGVTAGPGGAIAGAGKGAALGAGLGSIGGALDTPDKESVTPYVNPLQQSANLPEVQLANLSDAKKSLYQSSDFSMPQKDAYGSIYDQAQAALQKSLRMGGIG